MKTSTQEKAKQALEDYYYLFLQKEWQILTF